VLREHGIEVIDLGLQLSSWEPKENDAGAGQSLLEDKLTEIAVGNYAESVALSCLSKGF
jgi:hypothetical protein